ncbi:alpha/beta fold hydrolase [Marinilactibacillus kalidii]|uniref:alpha/beta fold hydrolase n=1 Tax=Marinilactibacillus kalidii TaxID=2820274 RepID=UPI001ABE69B6|nr:alpha/beta hydrolase [Marinilactibacillus kalidii]
MGLERVKPFPTSDGALLYYFDIGEGKPIVLLAGAETTVHTYQCVARKLKDNYRVIGLERRFEGKTIVELKDMKMERQGKDLHEFLAFIKVTHPVLVGHSLGGAVIMSYLAQFGDQEIASNIIVDQTPKMINDDTWSEGIAEKNVLSVFRNLLNTTLPLRKLPSAKINWLLINTMILKQKSCISIKKKKPLYKDYLKADWRSCLAKVTKPTLFVGTEYSPYWPARHIVTCADLVQQGTYCMMKKVSHGAHLEDSEQFAHIVKSWMRKLEE